MRVRGITAAVWRRGALEWCGLRRRASGTDVVRRGETPEVPPPGPETGDALTQAFRRIETDRAWPLTLFLPAREALVRVMDLPAANDEEWVAMAGLQMDKRSPFPADQTVTGAENLTPGKQPARILAASIRRDWADSVLAAAEQAGRRDVRLDLDILAWWRVLRDAGEIAENSRDLHMRLSGDEIWMLVCSGGCPGFLRVVAGPFETDADMREEMAYAFAALDVEHGESDLARRVLWADTEEEAERLANALPAEGPVPALRTNTELPPLSEGGAMRACEGNGLDLTPPAWSERQRRRRQSRIVFQGAAALLSVWLLAILGMTLAVRIQRARFEKAERDVQIIEAPADDVRALIERTRSLEDYADRSRSALEALREASRLLPRDITLTQFSYTKGRGVTLAGESSDAEIIYEFFGRLETSSLFSSVRPENVTSRGEAGAAVSQFRVSAELHGGSS